MILFSLKPLLSPNELNKLPLVADTKLAHVHRIEPQLEQRMRGGGGGLGSCLNPMNRHRPLRVVSEYPKANSELDRVPVRGKWSFSGARSSSMFGFGSAIFSVPLLRVPCASACRSQGGEGVVTLRQAQVHGDHGGMVLREPVACRSPPENQQGTLQLKRRSTATPPGKGSTAWGKFAAFSPVFLGKNQLTAAVKF